MSELTQTQLNALVTAYGAAAARAARAPRNTSAARCAFEAENAACASLLAAIGALVKERDEVQEELDEWRFTNGVDVLRRERDRLLHEHHQVRADAQSRVDAAVVRALAAEKALKEVTAKAGELVADVRGLVDESDGVAGLHLNGDVAEWGSLLLGGRFERLTALDDLEDLLSRGVHDVDA